MTILGIETSGFAGSVALFKENGEIVTRDLSKSGRRHAQSLVLEIDRLFDDEQLDRRACRAVAASIGPGSFTGLRVGVVCAKTWAYATGCELLAVDTFQAVAENAPAEVEAVFVIGDAQRGDVFVGRYQRVDSSCLERIGEIEIVSAETWIAERGDSDVVSGPGVDNWEKPLAEQCRLIPSERRFPTAANIVRIGKRMLEAGKTADLTTAEPFYLRRSAAEEKWDEAHGK